MKVFLKSVKILLLMITCGLLGSAYSVSLFGVDLTAPVKIVKTGIGQITKPLHPPSTLQPTLQSSTTNKLTRENNSTRKPIKDDHSPSDTQKVPRPVESSQNNGSKLEFVVDTLGWSETGVDYTTETDTETTTDINSIGGPPPAVLASLLGSG
ncbi:uncharacterized protein LOC134742956 [Cydia strobilella]|uniref:uncharacterized protein LOC134742956 n=1 Tax=Cydia strobilella TaxID=1100964 RepID=UPI00300583C1